ncbi:heme iron utilization protein HmuX [Shewanella putrefaciens]|nr:heme iron utilization protein HmuX [Shewanella putrefaciens]
MTLDTHIMASIEPDTEQVARHSMLRQRFEQQADLMPAQLASELGIAEMEVVAALPPEQVVFVPLTQLDTLLQMLPEWGNLTTIVMLSGSVFEFKGDFPQGKYAHGYYNLYSKGDGLHGHLKLDTMRGIALISRPFRGVRAIRSTSSVARGRLCLRCISAVINKGRYFLSKCDNLKH